MAEVVDPVEMPAAMLEKMARLDGSAEADIAMLTGISRDTIRELGGTGEGTAR